MRATTHYVFSLGIGFAAGEPWWLNLIYSVFAILPDLDNENNWFARRFRPLKNLSKKIYKRYGHRKFLHSIWAILILIIVFSFFSEYVPFWGMPGVNYYSHIFLDSFTKTTIFFFWPLWSSQWSFDKQCRVWGIRVGGKGEKILFIFIFMTTLTIFLFKTEMVQAVKDWFERIRKDFKAAEAIYQENPDFIKVAEFTYFDKSQQRKIQKKVPVLFMDAGKIVYWENGRKTVEKGDIGDENITILMTENRIKKSEKPLIQKAGQSLKGVLKCGSYCFYTGEIKVEYFRPEFKEKNIFVKPEQTNLGKRFELKFAMLDDFSELFEIETAVKLKIQENASKSIMYEYSNLQAKKGVYESQYVKMTGIELYNAEYLAKRRMIEKKLGAINRKLETLKLQLEVGKDPNYEEIKRLEQYQISYSLDYIEYELDNIRIKEEIKKEERIKK